MLPALILVILGPLILFKYVDFMIATAEALTGHQMPHLGWFLPLGISFVTFTLISLVVDTAKGRQTGPLNPLRIAVYITVFPHLIAGPILRARQVLPQLEDVRANWGVFGPSLALFAVGMVKKVLIADPVGAVVDRIYDTAGSGGVAESALATLGFGIQIYCDFSAYSDMAIALAAMIGLTFPENFRSPFIARSVTEFWRRWHITLSTWLRDYVLYPLYARLPLARVFASIFLTMLISGLWHGADWTFVIWGGVYGVLIFLERVTGYAQFAAQCGKGVGALLSLASFLVFLLMCILFRAPDLEAASQIFTGLLGVRGWGTWPVDGALVVGLSVALLLLHPFDRAYDIMAAAKRLPPLLVWPPLIILVATCALLAADRPATFYYFDF
jgi:alginate O-acetyltransferase complex protein AlgI